MSFSPRLPTLLFKITSANWEDVLSIGSPLSLPQRARELPNIILKWYATLLSCFSLHISSDSLLGKKRAVYVTPLVVCRRSLPVPNLQNYKQYCLYRHIRLPLLPSFWNILACHFPFLKGNLQVPASMSAEQDYLWKRIFLKWLLGHTFVFLCCCPHLAVNLCMQKDSYGLSCKNESFLKTFFPGWFFFSAFWAHWGKVGRKRLDIWKINVSWWAVRGRCATYTCISQGSFL